MLKLRKLLFGGGIATTLLLVFVLQLVHAVNHLVHEFEVKDCNHQYTLGKTEVGHAHDTFEKCFQCAFAFGAYLKPTIFQVEQPIAAVFIPKTHTSYTCEISGYSGFNLSLRAPPTI